MGDLRDEWQGGIVMKFFKMLKKHPAGQATRSII